MGQFAIAQKAIILFNKKVLLLQHSGNKWIDYKNKWDFVGGCLEFGEDLLMGLAREVNEETGLTVNVDKLLCAAIHQIVKPKEQLQFVHIYYLSFATSDKVKLSVEHKDYLWANRNQVLELIEKSVLKDSKTALDQLEIE
jgi:8-oxo-dGTP diphosphatase